MKKILMIFVIAALVFPGCFTDNSVNPDFGNLPLTKQWIPLQGLEVLTLDKEVLITHEINGKSGGVIEYDLQLANINVLGSLNIPRNAFSGTMNITALFNNRTTSQTFGPSPFEFGKSLLLTLEYTGVNLNGVDPSDIDFYYIGDDGQYYKAQYESLTVDPSAGRLKVVNAKLNHFSRWGWAKSATD